MSIEIKLNHIIELMNLKCERLELKSDVSCAIVQVSRKWFWWQRPLCRDRFDTLHALYQDIELKITQIDLQIMEIQEEIKSMKIGVIETLKNEEIQEQTLHPWDEFLKARMKAILWMKYEMGKFDNQIALDLSMDETQVRLIREYAEKMSQIHDQ